METVEIQERYTKKAVPKDDQHGRTLGKRTVAAVAIDAGPQESAATEESVTIGNGLYLPGRIGGERGQLPGRYGIRGVHPGGTHMEEMGPHGGRANQVLGAAVFGRRTSAGDVAVLQEKVTLDTPTSFSIRSTRATNLPSSNESGVTRPRAGRRNGNWLRTCWPSASSKRATARGVAQPS